MNLDSESNGSASESGADVEIEIEKRHFVASITQHNTRLDAVLVVWVVGLTRNYIQQLIAQSAVCINGKICTKSANKIKVGDVVEIEIRPTAQSQAFVAQAMHIDVLHQDEHLCVINKPAGLVVHPAPGNWQGTLLNGLLALYPLSKNLPRAGIVQRLDKDTSGVMVVAKTRKCMDALVALIAQRDVHRQYLALAHGKWQGNPIQEVEEWIGRDVRNRLRMSVVPKDSNGGKTAKTTVTWLHNIDVLPLTSINKNNVASCLVRCKLHTGRTHQIRVHMAHIGHPLVSDGVYGGEMAFGMLRQSLHAHVLAFTHPITHEAVRCVAPLPTDFLAALANANLDVESI